MSQRLVRQYDKRSGRTYFYTEEKIHDPVTGKIKIKRHIVGKLAADGSIVETGPKGRPKMKPTASEDDGYLEVYEEYKGKYESAAKACERKERDIALLKNALAELLKAQESLIASLQNDLDELKKKQKSLAALLDK